MADIKTMGNETSDPLILTLMRECIKLSRNCDISPTGFSVGSLLYLPKSSSHFGGLKAFFKNHVVEPSEEVHGLYLSGSWSRHLPGNTHAEANALTLFRERSVELAKEGKRVPDVNEVLRDVWCVASMEPCSVRTSGGPSCANSLVEAHVAKVFIGVQEPPDYVQCEGVRILGEGGVQVIRVLGLEEECLQAARRGL